MTNPSPSHTFRVRHCAYMRYFSSPSPPETCLPCLNIYAISSRCHVFTLIFRVSYTSNNEIQCIHKTERGRAGERERVEGEKRLNRQYLPQLENVGDILSPKSIWLGECFIWKGRLSGRTWCYELLKVQREGNYSVVGNATYVCVCAPATVCWWICLCACDCSPEEKGLGQCSQMMSGAYHFISIRHTTTVLTLFRLTTAFTTVGHSILIENLLVGISGTVLDWF